MSFLKRLSLVKFSLEVVMLVQIFIVILSGDVTGEVLDSPIDMSKILSFNLHRLFFVLL
jgi:hypothetical protein